jgi:hypothetical protein
MNDDRYNETNNEASSRIEEDLDCSLDDDLFNEIEMKLNVDNDINYDVNDFNVINNEYNIKVKKTRTILWRHVAFYIIPSLVKGRPNILMMKLILLHTKDEDRKPQV